MAANDLHQTYEGGHNNNRVYFKLPRVFPNQRERFESEDIFRQNAIKSEVKFTSYPDLSKEERKKKFEANCLEGYTEISISSTGLVLILAWNPKRHQRTNYGCDFVKEPGKVHIVAPFILNGVCVRWYGWIDLQKLEGFGKIEFDQEAAKLEESVMTKQVQMYNECTLRPTS